MMFRFEIYVSVLALEKMMGKEGSEVGGGELDVGIVQCLLMLVGSGVKGMNTGLL